MKTATVALLLDGGRMPRTMLLAMLAAFLALPAAAQVAQPGQAAAEHAVPAVESGATPAARRYRSFEAEPVYEVTVTATRQLREEDRIGDYAQPRWTAPRRFPTTRIYVVPSGTVHLEYWLDTKINLRGEEPARFRSQYEFELGLGHRLQFDLYVATEQMGFNHPWYLKEEKIELRYALADWGVIPTNPTLYLEFVRQHDGPPKVEGKLLLGGELARRWHGGMNFVFERELMGDELENEYALTFGLSYAVLDELFSLGLEVKGETLDVKGDRFSFNEYELQAGPSFQWRPVPMMHIDLVALFGAEVKHEGDESETVPVAQPLLVIGWEF